MTTDMECPCDWEIGKQDYKPASLTVHLHKRTFVFPWHTFLLAEGTDVDIVCLFHGHTVSVQGSGLSALLADLADQRVISLTERGRTARFRERAGPLVTAISVESKD